MTCPVCGATMTPRLSNRQKRTVCSKVCAAKVGAAHSIKRNDRAEDVAELFSWGVTPERVTERLGVTAGTLARSLYRAGRPDLAKPFEHLVNRDRWAKKRAA